MHTVTHKSWRAQRCELCSLIVPWGADCPISSFRIRDGGAMLYQQTSFYAVTEYSLQFFSSSYPYTVQIILSHTKKTVYSYGAPCTLTEMRHLCCRLGSKDVTFRVEVLLLWSQGLLLYRHAARATGGQARWGHYELLIQERGFLGVHLMGATLVPVSLVKQQWQQLAFFFSIVRLNRVKHNIRHHSVE